MNTAQIIRSHPIFSSPRAFIEAAEKTIEKHQDNVNATNEAGQCVYDNGDGCHCLIGQILVDNDLPLPEINLTIAAYLGVNAWEARQEEGELRRKAVLAANLLQSAADKDINDFDELPARSSWGELKASVILAEYC